MKEVQKGKAENIKAVLEECRSRGVTIDDLLELVSAKLEESGDHEAINTDAESTDIEMKVTNLLKEMGFPAHIRGYRYVRYAIIYALNNSEALDSMTKDLYLAVAKKFETTSPCVERAIRHAIEVAWDRGDIDVLQRYFGYTIQPGRGKPTNSEFIAMIVDNFRMNG